MGHGRIALSLWAERGRRGGHTACAGRGVLAAGLGGSPKPFRALSRVVKGQNLRAVLLWLSSHVVCLQPSRPGFVIAAALLSLPPQQC
jgi:hypothetical protein